MIKLKNLTIVETNDLIGIVVDGTIFYRDKDKNPEIPLSCQCVTNYDEKFNVLASDPWLKARFDINKIYEFVLSKAAFECFITGRTEGCMPYWQRQGELIQIYTIDGRIGYVKKEDIQYA